MKLRPNFKSIRFRIWFYVMLFSLAILLMLWLMQTVFLNVFYEGMKTESMKKATADIVAAYGTIADTDVFKAKLAEIVNAADVSARISDVNGTELFSVTSEGRNYENTLNERQIKPPPDNGYAPSGENGIPLKERFNEFSAKVLDAPDGVYMEPIDSKHGVPMLLYGKAADSPDGKKAVVMVVSMLQPLKDTVQILSRQLTYISLAIFVLALVMSLLVAMGISKPLTRITDKAKLLARGRYDMQFDRGGYTEVNQLADTLNYATGALQQVENTRRELIANVSHDLRTPLTMIKLYAEMIRDLSGENKQKREQNVAVIIEESNRLTSLVQNLLDLSQLQSGAMPYNPTVFDLTSMMKRILKRYDALVQQDGYVFKFRDYGDTPVKADEARIEQVIYNLLNNAVNYAGPDREITVAFADCASDGTIRVSISDNGEGIAPEKLEMIWERYYKVDKEHRRTVAGSGLGLSIVKSILDMHNMRYGVNSILGQGATFWFELKKAEKV